MADLATVTQIVGAARVLLQDIVAPYRYTDATLVQALNLAFMEIRRLRPDILIESATTPTFTTVDSSDISLDEMYRLPVLYFMVGYGQLQDDEATRDARAGAFLESFKSKLVGVA